MVISYKNINTDLQADTNLETLFESSLVTINIMRHDWYCLIAVCHLVNFTRQPFEDLVTGRWKWSENAFIYLDLIWLDQIGVINQRCVSFGLGGHACLVDFHGHELCIWPLMWCEEHGWWLVGVRPIFVVMLHWHNSFFFLEIYSKCIYQLSPTA